MREKRDDLPFDVQKMPLPSVDSEPTYAGWREYLEAIRPVVEAQHYSTLTGSQRKMLSLGMAEMVEGLEAPDLELAVPYEIYREKLALAKTLAWNEEKKGARALGGDRPSPVEDRPAQPEIGSLTPVESPQAHLVDPEIMQWSPSAEDLAWMERAYKQEVVAPSLKAPVTVPDLPWLPQGPAKIVALLRGATDQLGTVTLSQTVIVDQTGLDRRYVQRLLDRLVESTLLEVVRPGYRYRKDGVYRYQATQYRFSTAPDIRLAKAVLIRPAGRPRKLDRLGEAK